MRALLVSLATLAVLAPGARAQAPRPMTYNEARAYHLFLTSPYNYRTWSGPIAGWSVESATPEGGYVRVTQPPGYAEQRITPRGFESFSVIPGPRFQGVVPVTTLPEPREEEFGYPRPILRGSLR